ncbi:type VI secretion system baseplate subunit TssG [Pseudomonas sp. GD03860]|uniref:type VI secretion system baseplate subunit TssG n=1 Tax=Pseudomonas TaxID=286 RepID=UPI0023649E92|nr:MULTISPECIES: type VI secretion system baseplate subunit TssG [Pseudomonas]MDD2058595.1 type VI secretion system baseplate subunit TssG [Pseudomonas putida]MDH0639540.1 type VI secretion system baseplate subunit TssG [Pseudomonas sp. GD03860]
MHVALSRWQQLQHQAWRFDFFSALRCIESLHPQCPRLGTARRLAQDPLRLTQAVSMAFEPGMLRNLELREGCAPRLAVTFFGMTGVNGPMPLAFSEEVVSRQINHDDYVLTHFIDIFHHRLLTLLYRAWAQARPVVAADRPDEDRFIEQVKAFAPRSEVFYGGLYVDQRRSAEGLLALLRDYLKVTVGIRQWHGRWSALGPDEHLQLSARCPGAQLGTASLLGRRSWNVQHSVRIVLGPLSLVQWRRLLPGTPLLRGVTGLVNDYVGNSFEWDVQLLLDASARPESSLGDGTRLGLDTWLNSRRAPVGTRCCVLGPERLGSLGKSMRKQYAG